jgi:hypothetical protein
MEGEGMIMFPTSNSRPISSQKELPIPVSFLGVCVCWERGEDQLLNWTVCVCVCVCGGRPAFELDLEEETEQGAGVSSGRRHLKQWNWQCQAH